MNMAGGDAGGADQQMEMFRSGAVEIKTRKKLVEPRTEAQKAYVEALFKNELSFGIGPAGTGKTYLAVAVGVSMFITGRVDKIILSRPAVEAGERLGFLPGDMKEKVDPYMQPLYDALNDFLPGDMKEKVDPYMQPLYDALNDFLPAKQMAKLMEDKAIEIAPLAFMRGRTLANAFVVLDEAQNATSMQMKMFLTRLGEGSRMVITGDRTQIDLPRGVQSGLADAERLLSDIPKISFNYFTSKDVVRHPLVAAIIEAYDADGA
jgi:phosphate starvation-inducible PhoH-like protein